MGLSSRFTWNDLLYKTLGQSLAASELEGCLLTTSAGSDSDFTGEACWEEACKFLRAGGVKHGIMSDLTPKSICES